MQRMTDEKMLAQRVALRAHKEGRLVLLHGTELNIDPDGNVDWDAECRKWILNERGQLVLAEPAGRGVKVSPPCS